MAVIPISALLFFSAFLIFLADFILTLCAVSRSGRCDLKALGLTVLSFAFFWLYRGK